MFTDLRYAVRLLINSPAFTILVVTVLALGIGANTAVFSVVNGVLLKPLPFADAGRLVAIDTTVDDELRAEGIARDLVRAINDQRKALGFEIADRIRARIGATGLVYAAAHAHRDWIAGEVLAVELDVEGSLEIPGAARVEVDGEPVALLLERVER